MKQLFKLVIPAVFVLLAMSAQAQVKIGVKGGLNGSTISGFDALTNLEETISGYEVSSRAGFHAGIMANFSLPSNFFLQPELLFSLQGDKESFMNETGYNVLNYIQLPVYAGYKIKISNGLDVIVGIGPYFAYGLSGTDDAFNTLFKRLDIGASALAGIQFNRLQITLGYDLGLTDMIDIDGWKTAKDLLGLSSVCNRNVKLSIGYFFKN
jgi:hypothetical protein